MPKSFSLDKDLLDSMAKKVLNRSTYEHYEREVDDMKNQATLIAVLGLVLFLGMSPAFAGTVTLYGSEASFLGAIAPSYYLQDFYYGSGFTVLSNPSSFGPVNGFSYDISTPDDMLIGLPVGISTNNSDYSMLITLTGAPATAIGGLFFPTDEPGNVLTGSMTLLLGDGSSHTFDLSGFNGFTSTASIVSLLVNTDTAGTWTTIDHLYVGNASTVPEPGYILLLGIGLFGVSLAAYRFRL